ncbi:MAG: methylmalonyl Co-A mutase-associated GTPase MeaB [Phreatobacter sp.]|uniref:ArgK/MeaB family GTPase n=1 Tax=Phreatobacter sp. TaxID=1966341 RepID=UPI001A4CFCDB|nr:ATP-binding cassette domain-containing protein [Phreatobacter sp.]MBL8569542.1 methylmalonyl Co-A mutase-associated GTPase MeaB [Phreatobacter sp.]
MVPASIEAVRSGGKRALAAALAAIETNAGTPELAAFLDAACRAAKGATLGLTGPPGVGKSTLTNALVGSWRAAGETVGVIAIDPSSRRTGGALLGDRARISTNPEDRGVFVRSMAARDRLGGLSDQTVAAMVIMRAVFDRVLVESVGIGQSEADVAMVADTVVLCIQPGSGDSLQFMKAGVMELPDVIAVTKADMGAPARRAKADVEGALTLVARDPGAWPAPVVLVSSTTGEGMDDLARAIEAHRAWLGEGRLDARRAAQEAQWVEEAIRTRFGTAGTAAIRPALGQGPFRREHDIMTRLAARFG